MRLGVCVVLAAACLAGCGSVPTQNYYVLTPVAPTANASGNVNANTASNAGGQANSAGPPGSNGSAFAVLIDQTRVPELVDRPQFVISHSDHRVTILEQQRWAEPLRTAIPHVIAQDLAHELGNARVTVAPELAPADDAVRLSLDVQRFESRPGDAVTIEVEWTLKKRSGAANDTKTGRAIARESAGSGYEAVAAAHSKALGRIAREIAAAIAAFERRPPSS